MKKIFLDLDGTLARFNVPNALDRFDKEIGFFANLLAYKGIEVVNELAKEAGKERWEAPVFPKEYDELYDYISTPRVDGIPVEIAHNQETIAYDAYVSNGARAVRTIDVKSGVTHWGDLTINIIPMEAQVIPS